MRGMYLRVAWLAVGALVGTTLLAQAPANATAKCKDNTYSTATSARGMCSGHGGVAEKIAAKPAVKPATKIAAKTKAKPAATAAPAGATAKCGDGTYSHAKSTQGACSKHGGVAQVLSATTEQAAAPAAEPAPESPVASATVRRPSGSPATATAKCRDGTYSESQQHSGACSHHGGVAEWYR